MLIGNLYIMEHQSMDEAQHHQLKERSFEEMGFLLLVLLSLLFAAVAHGEGVHSSCSSRIKDDEHKSIPGKGIHLTLHHPRSPCSPAPLPADLPFSTVLRHDDRRVTALSSRLLHHHHHHHKNKSSSPSNASAAAGFSAPLTPGVSLGVGNYITKISLGTPATSYAMVVDTGSSLSWLQCQPCRISCHDQVGPIFDPAASQSYSTVPCSDTACRSLSSATLNPSACSSSNVCIYEASYGDSSFSVGYLSKDTLRIGTLLIPNFVYGCGQDNEGLFGKSAGLIGLAKNDLSLLSQATAKASITHAFSYCLPTMASVGSLSIGPYDDSKFAYTPMVSSSLDSTLYFIKLTAITLGGNPIPASASSYASTPTIIDSGTVITRLPSDIYSALSSAVLASLKMRYKQAPAYSILDTCFVGQANGIALPQVSLVFAGGAAMKLPVRNVLIDVDMATTCLAFAPSSRVAIVGNRQQQTFNVVYDVAKAKIGFAAGGCG